MKYLMLLALAFSVTAGADDPRVYLIAKVNIDQTTYNQVVFFYDRAVKDKATCEREVMNGMRGNWEYYRHLVGRARGFSLNAGYQCVVTPMILQAWDDHAPYNTVYMVDLRTDDVKLVTHENYSSCLGAVRKLQADEDRKLYCAKASQKVQAAN